MSGDENKSSAAEKSDDMIIETTNGSMVVDNSSSPMEVESNDTDSRKTQVEAEEGKITKNDDLVASDSSRPMDAEMKEGKAAKDSLVVGQDGRSSKEVDSSSRRETEQKEGKQALPSSAGVSVQKKPAKRRITPMAVDP